MRLLNLVTTLLIAFAMAGAGVWIFMKIGSDQRQLAAEMQSIQAGAVPPQTLVVVRKYVESHHRAPTDYHVVFRTPAHGDVDNVTAKSFYTAAQPGQSATGYRFGNAYLIPESRYPASKATAYVRWVLLIWAVIMAAAILLAGLLRFMNPPAASVGTMSHLIRQRMNQTSDL